MLETHVGIRERETRFRRSYERIVSVYRVTACASLGPNLEEMYNLLVS